MASADVAVRLDRTGLDLLAGHCACIFHRECVRFLVSKEPAAERDAERDAERSRAFKCERCRAFGCGVRGLLDRRCVRCGIYSAHAMCSNCLGTLTGNIGAILSINADNAVDIGEVVRGMLFTVVDVFALVLAWIILDLQQIMGLPFVLVEENGMFYGRSRAWAMVELWRKMLVYEKSVRLYDMGGVPFFLGFGGGGAGHQLILSEAMALLPQKGMQCENGLVTMLQKRTFLTDDGYFALGQTLCASGLFDFYEQKRLKGTVGRYFVASKNDFVYYNDRALLHLDADENFQTLWQTMTAAICVKEGGVGNEEK